MQSEDIKEIDFISYPKTLYISDGKGNITKEACFDLKRDQSDIKQNASTLKCHYNKDHLYHNTFKTRNEFIISPNDYRSMLNEPRISLECMCSRNLRTETKNPSNASDYSKIEIKTSQKEHTINQKHRIHAKPTFIESSHQVSEKFCSDKSTYCRPVLNFYNQELLFKTMKKNTKLRRLVTKLVIARRKEKEMENWNNYINDLRKKHCGDTKVKRATSLRYISNESETPDTIEDHRSTKFMCPQSNLCQNLLKDFYKPHDIRTSYNDHFRVSNEYTPEVFDPYKTNTLCFPTSSQGRLIMLEKERIKRLANCEYKPLFQTINEENTLECEGLRTINRKGSVYSSKKSSIVRSNRSTNTSLECTYTQTEFQIIPSKSANIVISKGCNTNHTVYEKGYNKEVHSKETGSEYFNNKNNNLRKKSLVCIEEKLDNLIHFINNFIKEMKTNSAQHKTFDQYTKMGKRNVNYTRSDSCSMAKNEKKLCELIDDSSRTTRNSSIDNFNRIQTIDKNLTKINDILLKRIGKNQFITLKSSSVGETYHPCSVQISVTIPTKEISTEVTRSLSKAANLEDRHIIIEEIPKRKDRRIAIAVNTDPLSLLAMLKVSTEETIRRLMSYLPTIDYYSYLSRLQGPSPGIIESQYVCNICGAAFKKPSALTEHIQKHELGNTRDCCVCRRVLDLPRRCPGLFKCQYCGQRFTRAYCCELHQEECAKRLGKVHDVTSSLVLLR